MIIHAKIVNNISQTRFEYSGQHRYKYGKRHRISNINLRHVAVLERACNSMSIMQPLVNFSWKRKETGLEHVMVCDLIVFAWRRGTFTSAIGSSAALYRTEHRFYRPIDLRFVQCKSHPTICPSVCSASQCCEAEDQELSTWVNE